VATRQRTFLVGAHERMGVAWCRRRFGRTRRRGAVVALRGLGRGPS
jgi:hypothetical protein